MPVSYERISPFGLDFIFSLWYESINTLPRPEGVVLNIHLSAVMRMFLDVRVALKRGGGRFKLVGYEVWVRRWWLSQVMWIRRIVLSDEVIPCRIRFPITHQDRHCDATWLLVLELAGRACAIQQVSLSLVFVATILEPDLHLGWCEFQSIR
jgi:hypothetical protein